MIYLVRLLCNGEVVDTREVFGMAEVEKIQACYEDSMYEVDFEPDAFRYLNLNRDARLS